jgi:hypothetical protein
VKFALCFFTTHVLGVSFGYCGRHLSFFLVIFSSIPELHSSAVWVEQGFHKNFKPFTVFTDNVERISVDKISPQEFIERFERPYLPVRNEMLLLLLTPINRLSQVVILDAQREWMANYKWTIQASIC